MVDCELNLEGWLDDATLFSNGPSDYNLNFDLLKTNNEVAPVTEFNELPWLDENVNLSLFQDPTLQLGDPNNIQLSESDIKELISFISSNSDNSYLSSDSFNPSFSDFDLNNLQSPAASTGSSSDLPFSPEYEAISEASSPAAFSFSSDYDNFSEGTSPAAIVPVDTVLNELSLSPENIPSPYSQTSEESMPAVFVTVCDDDTDIASQQVAEALSIEEVSDEVRNRKFVNTGKEIPKIRVSLRNAFHPYSKATYRKGRDKSERKKVQNKEAAARYRIKKRLEEKELSDEVAELEAEQKELKSKHDDLETEIKYLKKLMREILEKKGVI